MTPAESRLFPWLDAVCRQFSEATGWPLRFAAAGTPLARDFEARGVRHESCWSAELGDGLRRLGFLFIELPDDRRSDRSFLGISELAAMVADLAGRYCAASRKLESRSQEVTTLAEIGRTLPNQDNLREAIERLLQAALKLTGYRSAAFFLFNPTSGILRARAEQHSEPRKIPLTSRTLEHSPPDRAALVQGKALLRTDVAASAAHWLPPDCTAACCFRVQSQHGPLGTLWTFDRRTRTPSDREVHVLESIAAQIGAVLERTVLLHESASQQRLQRELKVASENQSFGLPRDSLLDPRVDVAVLCTSHYEVGGDLCEAIPLDARRTLLAVGDAAGDSIPAALVMSLARGALRALAAEIDLDAVDVGRLVGRLNAVLHDATPSHLFMSLVLGVIDTARGSFTYCNAGHPLPIVVRNGNVEPMKSHGMLLGVSVETDYEQSTLQVGAGDLLVFYSDGISEARGRGKRMFRSEGILDVVRDCEGQSADEVMSTIMSRLQAHLQGAASGDDRTLLVARLKDEVAAPLPTH